MKYMKYIPQGSSHIHSIVITYIRIVVYSYFYYVLDLEEDLNIENDFQCKSTSFNHPSVGS